MNKIACSLQHIRRRRPLPKQRNFAARAPAAGEDRYCIRVQPPLACDKIERCRWASSFIEASGIEVIKHFYSLDRTSESSLVPSKPDYLPCFFSCMKFSCDAAFKLSLPAFGFVVRVSSGFLCYVHADLCNAISPCYP
ncbi:hypothetical protein Tco_0385432 [Tanacetum coccineum]